MTPSALGIVLIAVSLASCGANGNGSGSSYAEKPATADRFAQPIFEPAHFPFAEVIPVGEGGELSGGQYGVCLRTRLLETSRKKPYQCELGFLFGIELQGGRRITKQHARYLSAQAMNRAVDARLPARTKADQRTCDALRSYMQPALRRDWPGARVILCFTWRGNRIPLSGIEPTLRVGKPGKPGKPGNQSKPSGDSRR